MFFKNLTVLQLADAFALNGLELEAKLEARRFVACGSLEPRAVGWVSPLAKNDAALVHQANGYLMICLKVEDKVLPSGVINEVVSERVEAFSESQGRFPSRKERESIRDEVLTDLLPRAFSQSRKTYAYLEPRKGWLVIDAASPRKAEDVVALLRQCLDGFPVRPLRVQERPGFVMTEWLAKGNLPDGVTLENECELKSKEEDGAVVRCRKQDLVVPEMLNHIEAGKELIKLALTFNDRLSLVLDDTLAIRRLKFLDTPDEAPKEEVGDDPVRQFDADFTLMTLEFDLLLSSILGWFGGEVREDLPKNA